MISPHGSKVWFIILEGEVAVSTTRPETMLGDVAIAVHPNDPRYKVKLQFFQMSSFIFYIVF